MLLQLRITSIDHDGWNGRDFCPDDSDLDLIVTPLKMVTMFFSEDGDVDNDMETEELIGHPDRAAEYASDLVMCYTCVTKDGRLLELMDHEVAVVTFSAS